MLKQLKTLPDMLNRTVIEIIWGGDAELGLHFNDGTFIVLSANPIPIDDAIQLNAVAKDLDPKARLHYKAITPEEYDIQRAKGAPLRNHVALCRFCHRSEKQYCPEGRELLNAESE